MTLFLPSRTDLNKGLVGLKACRSGGNELGRWLDMASREALPLCLGVSRWQALKEGKQFRTGVRIDTRLQQE